MSTMLIKAISLVPPINSQFLYTGSIGFGTHLMKNDMTVQCPKELTISNGVSYILNSAEAGVNTDTIMFPCHRNGTPSEHSSHMMAQCREVTTWPI